jgi:hypothetical protein
MDIENKDNQISQEEYEKLFEGEYDKNVKIENALKYALDIRKFEIDLYWKRTTYFWTLIAAVFAGYFALTKIEQKCPVFADINDDAFIVSCIGLIFTWAWYLVNRGSKFWQENWENHVDMLEDAVTGPLYKIVLSRTKKNRKFTDNIIGPWDISVSKVNQWVSFFVVIIWLVFIGKQLFWLYRYYEIDQICWLMLSLTVVFMFMMTWRGKTHKEDYDHIARKRETKIIKE